MPTTTSKYPSESQEGARDAANMAKHAYAEAKDQVNATAARVGDAATQVKERGQELLHTAADRASHAYHQASDYAQEAAYEARDRARLAARYARDASDVGLSFVSTHALPLSMIGLGLGWLALSVRNDRRMRELDAVYVPRHVPTLRGETRQPVRYPEPRYAEPRYAEPRYAEPRTGYAEPRVSDGTTESPKLLGVRTIDVSPRSDFGPTS